MTRALLFTVVILLGAVAGVFGYQVWDQDRPEPRPDLTLPDLQEQPRSLSEWDGRLIVLNFWATWCPPCVEEMPLFQRLQDEYGDRGLQFIGVAVDRPDAVAEFVAEHDIRYPILYGRQAAMSAGQDFGNQAGTLPWTVIIDREGHIRHVFDREVSREQIEPVLLDLL
ncbi:TlpA family protein disulfide reductase [Alkalilimnicola ehrlichii MLHE-1]|uniref:Redoxin domain protein n=1 Tax=Alkalilimnicola ehrlichii (strain ATCC BAA-1101 / DSM 17681 / MLHE-1) TaxID=187272 RepID=Q0ACQ5_ALKEH|nr:TlpA disulfide reductase family protein [Alkalilimnicola ehrlichii]ABI55382.1 Redoxin domain protein [Alkalilimnicola ehrlichii MLHE-1]